ncbi:MAG: hypothetical protein ACR2IK_10875 [Chloroflexota bacterium]
MARFDLRGVPLEQRTALLGRSVFPSPAGRVRIVEALARSQLVVARAQPGFRSGQLAGRPS